MISAVSPSRARNFPRECLVIDSIVSEVMTNCFPASKLIGKWALSSHARLCVCITQSSDVNNPISESHSEQKFLTRSDWRLLRIFKWFMRLWGFSHRYNSSIDQTKQKNKEAWKLNVKWNHANSMRWTLVWVLPLSLMDQTFNSLFHYLCLASHVRAEMKSKKLITRWLREIEKNLGDATKCLLTLVSRAQTTNQLATLLYTRKPSRQLFERKVAMKSKKREVRENIYISFSTFLYFLWLIFE